MDFFDNYYDDDILYEHFRTEKPDPANFTMHTHDTNELLYFISGNGVFHVEGTAYKLCDGDIIITRRGEAHYIEIDKNTPYERAYINFDQRLLSSIDPSGALMKSYFERDAGTENQFSSKKFSESISIHLQNFIKQGSDRRTQILSGLIPILNEIKIVFESRGNTADEVENTLIFRIINYINSNIFDDISLDGLCEKFYISKSYLCQIFKKSTGSTVNRYVTVKRLMAAQDLIRMGNPPTKVYLKCGFSDYSVFYRAYKNRYGHSPNECKKHKGKN